MTSGSGVTEPARDSYALASRLMATSKYTVALTGAGISTPSGIPDFRSPGTGLWEHHDPTEVASLTAFRYHPEQFFDWVRPVAEGWLSAVPNPAHLALARLEAAGLLHCLVTQNVDDLHQRAGSTRVLAVHGSMQHATCVSCYRRYDSARVLAALQPRGGIPRCPECDGVLKPDIILYGEQLPYDVLEEAQAAFRKATLVLVAGSSLEVTPAAALPLEALRHGSHLVIVNRYPTYLDVRADATFQDDVAIVLPRLVDQALHALS